VFPGTTGGYGSIEEDKAGDEMNATELRKVLSEHAKWLDDRDTGTRANLRCADLYGADLRCANLRCADLYGADLHCADLHCADLHCADLR